MLCGQRRIGPMFTLIMKASLIWVRWETLFSVSNWRKTEPRVRKEVSERWMRKCHGLGDVLCSRSWASYTPHGRVNANVCQNLLRQHVVPSLCSLPNQPAIFMQDNSPCHTAKWVKQFLEAKNTEIMKWPAQSPDLNPIQKSLENPWQQSYG